MTNISYNFNNIILQIMINTSISDFENDIIPNKTFITLQSDFTTNVFYYMLPLLPIICLCLLLIRI